MIAGLVSVVMQTQEFAEAREQTRREFGIPLGKGRNQMLNQECPIEWDEIPARMRYTPTISKKQFLKICSRVRENAGALRHDHHVPNSNESGCDK